MLVKLSLHRLQGVWASKYNERALLSMRKVGLDFRDLRMAVLVQRVVPAAYAFVIHTHNPSTGHAPVKSPCMERVLLSKYICTGNAYLRSNVMSRLTCVWVTFVPRRARWLLLT